MRLLSSVALLGFVSFPLMANAAEITLKPTSIVNWKAVYGTVEARDSVIARARIGGTITELKVTEGDSVTAGQVVALVKDDKLDFQIKAIEAQLKGLNASLKNAELEMDRAERLIKSGATTAQRRDQLRTEVDVIRNQIAAAEAQRSVVIEQANEGEVLAPTAGRVLKVPVTRDAVVMPGEVVANIGGGGLFLRLAIPERHAASLKEGASIRITANSSQAPGKLVKIYPQIENGRVIADVEVADMPTDFVFARILVEVPVGERQALLVPRDAVETRSGIDFVKVSEDGKPVERAVVVGDAANPAEGDSIEILTGLSAGDKVIIP